MTLSSTSLFLLLALSTAHAISLPFQLEVATYWEPTLGSYARIRVAISYDELLFVKTEDGFTARYGVSYRVTDAKGHQVHSGFLSGTIQVFTFAETNKRHLLAHEEVRLTLPAGNYAVRVTVEDVENRRHGTQERSFEIPPSGGGYHLSSLTVLGCGEERETLGDTLPDPCEGITVVGELYAPTDSVPTVLPLRVRVVDGRGKTRSDQQERITVSGSVTPFEAPVSITRLEAGTYEVRVDVRADDTELAASKRIVIPWSISGLFATPDDAIRLLSYLGEKETLATFKKLPRGEREAFWIDYWASRDPVPSTPRNELMELYEARIMYANDHFSAFEEGWKTDMGMVYVKFGPPDDIERHPFDRNAKPYEIWTYHALKRQFVFVDRTGFGRYDLVEGDVSSW